MSKILIVDDSAPFRKSLKRVLSGQFPSVDFEEAIDGEEALAKTGAFRPRLIFMDIRMPDRNGLEITKELKENYPQSTVIVLTHYDLPEYRQAAKQSGADHFLSKDTSMDTLLELTGRILSHKIPETDRGPSEGG